MVEKTYSPQTCSFCKGTGTAMRQRLDEAGIALPGQVEATCIACDGKGSVMVKNPAKICPYCKGVGYVLAPNPCMSCKGTGWTGAKRE